MGRAAILLTAGALTLAACSGPEPGSTRAGSATAEYLAVLMAGASLGTSIGEAITGDDSDTSDSLFGTAESMLSMSSYSDGSDSCEWANDGVCDEPAYCPYGTDTSDCGGSLSGGGWGNTCQWANDGMCDEPNLCAPSTDSTDCGMSVSSSDGNRCSELGKDFVRDYSSFYGSDSMCEIYSHDLYVREAHADRPISSGCLDAYQWIKTSTRYETSSTAFASRECPSLTIGRGSSSRRSS